ncbi:MAG: hypothetical protein JNM88_17240 [Chitinophagaceae bacterium]|nr:hypothetical protein [Chitinophagaceae bacterium]
MKILFQRIYKFNLDTNRAEEQVVPADAKDFNDYIFELIEDVARDKGNKKFNFPKEVTATKTILAGLNDGKKDTVAVSFAERLIKIEIDVQNKIDHLDQEVQKGIMLQALVDMGNYTQYYIIKAEHFDFINEKDNKRTTGLPIKRKIFKSFYCTVPADGKFKNAYVNDNRASITTYWWKTFLELEPEFTDDYNTERAFTMIESKVLNKFKESHKSDYAYLRNATVAYFRANDEFVMEEYVKKTFEKYVPEDDGLNMKAISSKLKALPENNSFDNRFNIKKEKVRKRFIKRVELSPQLDLILKENIDWGKTIVPVRDNKGAKCLQIRTDEGFDYFEKAAK